MSRALDPGTASAISEGNSQKTFADISKALSTNTDCLLEIEFLGKSHPLPPDTNVLVDGNNIAVTKAKLVQAFVVARLILLQYLKDCPDDKISQLRDATAVILLMDPEHLTAANTRKRLIQRFQHGPEAEFKAVLKKELLLVDSYLTSRLHRHTKSPTLWGHRRWILMLSTSSHDILKNLQSVVLVAAERHPKNYYAWSHMRWLIRTYTCATESSSVHGDDFSKIIKLTKDWCLRHPNDTSGFSFLLFALSHFQPPKSVDSELSNMCSGICSDVLHLAVSFKWTHESAWVFLRTLVAEYGTDADVSAFYIAIDDISHTNSKGQTVLKKAKDWCSSYKEQSSGHLGDMSEISVSEAR